MTYIKFSRISKYTLLAAVFLFCGWLAAQEKPKVVVVLEPTGNEAVSDANKKTARRFIEEVISETGTHRVVDSGKADQISSDPSYQKVNGVFNDADVMDIGDQLRADLVFTSEILKEGGEIVITVSMMDVKTGKKNTRSDVADGEGTRQIRDLIDNLTPKLLGIESPQERETRIQAEKQEEAVRRAEEARIQAERQAEAARQAETAKQAEAKQKETAAKKGGGGGFGSLVTIGTEILKPKLETTLPPILTGDVGASKGTVPGTVVTYDVVEVSEGTRVRIRFDNDSTRSYSFNWKMENSENLRGGHGRWGYDASIIPPSGPVSIGANGTLTIFLERIETNRGFRIGRMVFD